MVSGSNSPALCGLWFIFAGLYLTVKDRLPALHLLRIQERTVCNLPDRQGMLRCTKSGPALVFPACFFAVNNRLWSLYLPTAKTGLAGYQSHLAHRRRRWTKYTCPLLPAPLGCNCPCNWTARDKGTETGPLLVSPSGCWTQSRTRNCCILAWPRACSAESLLPQECSSSGMQSRGPDVSHRPGNQQGLCLLK